jgi:two-component system, NarL family, sensor histidine kinase DesK
MTPVTTPRTATTRGSSLARWFSLVWLTFLGFPLLELYGRPRPTLEHLYGSVLLMVFVVAFVWAFFLTPWSRNGEGLTYRPASLIGMGVSYAVMGLLVPVIQWSGIGMLIYAGSFAGTQLSLVPSAFAVVASLVACISLVLIGMPWFTAFLMIFFTITAAFGNHVSYREIITANRLRRSQLEVERVARIAERERIARDLHDLLGHTLSVIVLKSELASRLADRDPTRAAAEIRDVERIARESLQEVRSAVRGYRSAGLEGEFASVRLACEAAGLKLELYLVPVELEWASEQAFSYVLRESVTNTIRHANARTLWVSLERVADNARLSIWDDGTGRITENNGVRGMRERLEALGGTLEIDATDKGITATLPVRAASTASSEPTLEHPGLQGTGQS